LAKKHPQITQITPIRMQDSYIEQLSFHGGVNNIQLTCLEYNLCNLRNLWMVFTEEGNESV